jgi:transposase
MEASPEFPICFLNIYIYYIYELRTRVEWTFAWEDKFKRLLLRFEHIQQRHYGMKLLAYTLINLRGFCVT